MAHLERDVCGAVVTVGLDDHLRGNAGGRRRLMSWWQGAIHHERPPGESLVTPVADRSTAQLP
jgi:hypothetical protein